MTESRTDRLQTTSNGRHGTRLSDDQWSAIRHSIESAISRGWDEIRVYWPDGEVSVSPVRMGKKERV